MPRFFRQFVTNPLFCAALVFCGASAVGLHLIEQLNQARQNEALASTNELATLQARALEHKIMQALSATYAVAALVHEQHGMVTNFESFASRILVYQPDILAFYLAPDGITREVVPSAWRTIGLGINLLTDPLRGAEAQLAKNTGQLSLAGPFTLSRGDVGVVGRLPVFLNLEHGERKFWGLVTVVISVPELLKKTGLAALAARGHEYQLWRNNPGTGLPQIIDQSKAYQAQYIARQTLNLPNSIWTLDVMSAGSKAEGWVQAGQIGAALLFALLLAALVRLVLEARIQQRRMEKTITDRTAELALRESDLCRAQMISRTGSWINYAGSLDMECSDEARRIWGITAGTRINRDLVIDQIHPLDRERILQLWQESLAGERYEVEYRLLIDGEIRWVLSQVELDRGRDGLIVRRIGVLQDMTERKRIEADLQIAAIAFEGQEGMVITDEHRTILRVNQAFSRMTGYSREEALGQSTRLLKSGMHGSSYYQDMSTQLDEYGYWQGEIWNRRKNGEIYPEWLTITAVKAKDGKPIHYVAAMQDITQRKATEAKLEHLAYHDPLTGLANRRLLLDRLQHGLASNSRNLRHGAVLFLDLDNFKTINDIHGHATGDLLLQQVALRLAQNISKGDTLARIGGDEFALILENLSDQIGPTAIMAKTNATNILEQLKLPYWIDGHDYHTSASIGIQLFNGDSSSAEELLKQVEVAMYQAKAEDGSHVRFFDPHMLSMVTARATMEADMRCGLSENQFILYYQPQVNSAGHTIGAEALVRWQHPHKGMIAPADFIPLAEESGLIIPLGTWVLQAACKKLRLWENDPATAELTMAVNVSARQFRQADFVAIVLTTIQQTAISACKLKLELTESLLVENIEETIQKMNQLKSHGVCFSLDDFGTGYSSLSYLKRLPLDQLKIDQSFVRDILLDPNDAAITRTIIGLGKSLGLAVIAEGVETEAQRAFLQSQDCHAFQGYLFGRPAPELPAQSNTAPFQA
ncbi:MULTISPECIES: EAL domain-containing protein [unclassified Undibacterium]|uniref:bifunctional diguanylate cyclase/phosphodiesterase n=1 Tax=unclassified Undibacterium TaxID=2630295 RepID=UPI002AC8F96A|nr:MULTISPECIES: EAL domain-containing protein [unclassified Undibacterium]MEB0139053.1 EAL domain-containing protein [Undibacterium sp. CCC2.1]MEB0172990.1 EAL domain-containing protein [Undibacterium sp. CCC1.1]MEB0177955.1 EAL domain-containing protein [Undibacterium sp. CCC3.4]MEB0215908.1 EAL domain-containing protein [Undibacterium sp. 5I2]WPX42109.1 EAL domain-containing protein [Undibacterium sp. CCC3.4]